MTTSARLIALYLPQFHPIPENDAWWGKGFTEWTNTAKARPLFAGHYQPHIPADLGFYDLRVPETREAQAALARAYGIEAFCYYHYWFGDGRRLLERPFEEVLASGEPDFPFCLCWANESWTGRWHGLPNKTLVSQTYPGEADHRAHFAALLPAFRDKRYVRVDGKPLFVIYRPGDLPDANAVTALWQDMALEAGLPGLHLVGVTWHRAWDPVAAGFDAGLFHYLPPRFSWHPWSRPVAKVRAFLARKLGRPFIHAYKDVLDKLLPPASAAGKLYPTVLPGWDNTPRSGRQGLVLKGATPALFRRHLDAALALQRELPPEHRIVFVKSWNEWAEGNHLEPDLRDGHAFLEVVRDALKDFKA